MSLSIVSSQLKQWADSAALRAQRANDPDSIAAFSNAADQFRRLMAAVQGGATELAALQQRIAAAPAMKAPAVRRSGGMGAFAFWRLHGQAVAAIVAVYGPRWKILAPLGETTVVSVPPGCTSAKGELGTTMHWIKDHRVPAAHYWPDGRLPTGMVVGNDQERVWDGYGPPVARDSAAWHKAHGYVWDHGQWCHEVEVRNALGRAEAIETYRAAVAEATRLKAAELAAYEYGPQPFVVEDEVELMAAE